MFDHAKILGIENISTALILIDRQVFSRAFFLHNRVFPAARMCARSLVGISSGKVIGQ